MTQLKACQIKAIDVQKQLDEANKHWAELKDVRIEVLGEFLLQYIRTSKNWKLARYMPRCSGVVFQNSFTIPDGLKCFNTKWGDILIKVAVKNDEDKVDVVLKGPAKTMQKFFAEHNLWVDKELLKHALDDLDPAEY
jgi:hypothetical protein